MEDKTFTNEDLALAVSRAFERIEERMDAMESRLYARLSEVQDRLEERIEVLEERLMHK